MKTVWGVPPHDTVTHPLEYDTLIIGAGLAGASAAWHLRGAGQRVAVLDANRREAATGVGGGLANPMMALRGRPPWRVREALDILEGMPEEGRLGPAGGLLRPAADAQQAAFFAEAAAQHPDLGRWLDAGEASVRFPYTHVPHGVLEVMRGGAWDLEATAESWLWGIERIPCTARWTLKESGEHVVFHDADVPPMRARRALLAMGAGLLTHPLTRTLNLHGIKGQILRAARPSSLPDGFPPLSGAAYLIQADADSLWIGSTFEHDWTDARPTPEARNELLERASTVVPELRQAEVIEHRVGFRVTVPGTRLPMVGPLHPDSRIWVLGGFGAKGLIYSALLGHGIPAFFNDPEAIPAECRVVHRTPES
jgi:D-amino-acid dehydrogenase